MHLYQKAIFRNREHAAQLLAEKLVAFKNNENAIVMAIPRGGVPIGYQLAERLGLPLGIVPCCKLKDPTGYSRSIGSVSIDDAVVNEESRNIPQDYIYRQIVGLQTQLKVNYDFYTAHRGPLTLTNKTVIVADDILRSGDTLMACLKSIRKQNPKKIVVAIPVISAEHIEPIKQVVNDFVFLFLNTSNYPSPYIYGHFPEVTDDEVKQLLERSKEPLAMQAVE